MSHTTAPAIPPTVVNIPISLALKNIEKSINTYLKTGQRVYNEALLKIPAISPIVGTQLKLSIKKVRDITLYTQKHKLYVRIPLHIQLAVVYGSKRFVQVKPLVTEATVVQVAQIQLRVNPQWTISTSTKGVGHEWIKRPSFTVLGIPLAANLLVERAILWQLAEHINQVDTLIGPSIPLKSIAQKVWENLQVPIEISDFLGLWATFDPKNIRLSTVFTENQRITVFLYVLGVTHTYLLAEKAKYTRIKPKLPTFNELTNVTNSYDAHIVGKFTYASLDKLLQEHFLGYTYEANPEYAFTVNKINLSSQRTYLVVAIGFTGAAQGTIYLKMRPLYEPILKRFKLYHFNYTLQSFNVLLQAANVLNHASIVQKVGSAIETWIDEQIHVWAAYVKQYLRQQSFNENMVALKGSLTHYAIDLRIHPSHITVVIVAGGQAALNINL